ncbi:BTB/POZ domain-containing protein 6 isoform X2 [Ixodes scapularis]|nr:BTB/POZ domain-containing protein 6 isoform X2 [Ixodes scapularis]
MAKPVNVAAPKRDDLHFFTEGRHTDVEFLVEHGSDPPKSFKAHKMVLAMRNEVFETMFYGSLPEKNQVRVTDLHPDGFSAFLKYLYSQKATFVDVKQALHTRTAAEKYMESELVEACHRFIKNSMQSTDVCDVLEYAAKNGNLANFNDLINKFLNMSGVQVLESKAFIAASKETVLTILKNPQLCVKEYDVIKSVYAWAIACCGKETGVPSTAALQWTMRPFLPELRFLTLSPLEFVEGPVTWNILTESEALAVLSSIVKLGSKEWPVGFCTNRRARTGVTLTSGVTMGDCGVCGMPITAVGDCGVCGMPITPVATQQRTTKVVPSVGVTPNFGQSNATSFGFSFGRQSC